MTLFDKNFLEEELTCIPKLQSGQKFSIFFFLKSFSDWMSLGELDKLMRMASIWLNLYGRFEDLKKNINV